MKVRDMKQYVKMIRFAQLRETNDYLTLDIGTIIFHFFVDACFKTNFIQPEINPHGNLVYIEYRIVNNILNLFISVMGKMDYKTGGGQLGRAVYIFLFGLIILKEAFMSLSR